MSLETVRIFAISKLVWIKRERRKLQDQARETPREYLDRESHFVWGERKLLRVEEVDAAPSVTVLPNHLFLRIRPGSDADRREALLARWCRDQVRAALPSLLPKWEAKIGVTVAQVFVQKMKTKWGSCNPDARNIRLSSELAQKTPECLEYILVHELTHLLEPTPTIEGDGTRAPGCFEFQRATAVRRPRVRVLVQPNHLAAPPDEPRLAAG